MTTTFTGNADGFGDTRKEELYNACATLKVLGVLHFSIVDCFQPLNSQEILAQIVTDDSLIIDNACATLKNLISACYTVAYQARSVFLCQKSLVDHEQSEAQNCCCTNRLLATLLPETEPRFHSDAFLTLYLLAARVRTKKIKLQLSMVFCFYFMLFVADGLGCAWMGHVVAYRHSAY